MFLANMVGRNYVYKGFIGNHGQIVNVLRLHEL
jgi:hypothetical protein